MLFGLMVCRTFQKVKEAVLALVLNDFVHVYLEDIIITSFTFAGHINHLRQAFELLQKSFLTLKMGKYNFSKNEIQYLRFRLTREGGRAFTIH